tara:strand:- start:990 stop:2480 length:1491 start_codon:yes stop_codon:yes gene_type:complete
MSKTNFFLKFLKIINDFINSLLEKNLNKLNFKNFSYLLKNNKIILTFVAFFVIFISYLLYPTFFDQSDISKKLEAELQNKFDLNFKFSQSIKYNLFPRPHFTVKKSTILDEQTEISKINKLKIFISLENLFSVKNFEIKDLIFENANFNLNQKNFNFFINLLNNDFKNGDLIIKNSNIFFRSLSNDVLFVNKILKIKYYYEPKEIKNIIFAENEIFNIPFSIKLFFNEEKNIVYSSINLDLIKLKIENELNLENKKKFGKSDFIFNQLKRTAEYEIENNYFKFNIFDKVEDPGINYNGVLNFKPFYGSLQGDLNEINLNYLFGTNSIISQLLKTEIFNNKNILFNLNINAKNIYNNFNFKNLNLNSKIQEGLIDSDYTKFEWKDFANFELLETLIFVRNGELVLDGKLKVNINNLSEVYKYLLTPKNYRNKINHVDLNFTYNFDKKTAELKDIKIDNKINQNVNKILNNVILKSDNLQNKIYFKNLLNEALKSYAG